MKIEYDKQVDALYLASRIQRLLHGETCRRAPGDRAHARGSIGLVRSNRIGFVRDFCHDGNDFTAN